MALRSRPSHVRVKYARYFTAAVAEGLRDSLELPGEVAHLLRLAWGED
jgi:hypothetical protein